jgi:hypothetical protein
MSRRSSRLMLAFAAAAAATAGLRAQPSPSPAGYLVPPKVIVDILDAAPTPTVTVATNGKMVALLTFPVQSERLWMALKGFGATVRYVTLPYEAHGHVARESVLHTIAETINWLDKYVKNAPPRAKTTTAQR